MISLALEINYTLLITSVLGSVLIFIPKIMEQRRELKKMQFEYTKQKTKLNEAERKVIDYEIKTSLFDRIMDIESINNIKDSVDRMFKETKAQRFLLLIAMNGKESPNIVSVIFEQHKESEVKYLATIRYKNVPIDDAYRNMLKRAELEDYILFNTEKENDCKLKEFYKLEGVKHSFIKHLVRKPIDSNNDFLVYSSIATFNNEPFTSKEKTFILTEYDSSVKNNLNNVINNRKYN